MSTKIILPVQRYPREVQEKFRPLLKEKIFQKEKEIKFLRSSVTSQKEGCHTSDFVETNSNEKALNATQVQLDLAVDFLESHLKPALRRIDFGVYGTCRASHKLIPIERLKLTPHATLRAEEKPQKKRVYQARALNPKWI